MFLVVSFNYPLIRYLFFCLGIQYIWNLRDPHFTDLQSVEDHTSRDVVKGILLEHFLIWTSFSSEIKITRLTSLSPLSYYIIHYVFLCW